jgi:hypothetical protein
MWPQPPVPQATDRLIVIGEDLGALLFDNRAAHLQLVGRQYDAETHIANRHGSHKDLVSLSLTRFQLRQRLKDDGLAFRRRIGQFVTRIGRAGGAHRHQFAWHQRLDLDPGQRRRSLVEQNDLVTDLLADPRGIFAIDHL